MNNILERLNKTLTAVFLIGLISISSGCSKAERDDIQAMIKADFGGYTKKKPLVVYYLPFKPNDKFDTSSVLGNVFWDLSAGFIRDTGFFTSGKIVTKIFEAEDYVAQLRTPYWNDIEKTDEKVTDILKETAEKHNVDVIVYGLYDGDDSAIKMVINVYSRKDNILLKEKIDFKVPFAEIINFRNVIKSVDKLTYEQKAIQKKMNEKLKVAGINLLRKYVEGPNK